MNLMQCRATARVNERLGRLAALATLAGAALLGMLAIPAHAANEYARTRYPIILVHGMLGWDRMGGYDYFYGIPRDLQANGAQVFVAELSGLHSTEVRGEQLLSQVRQVLALTGAPRINLIGHSHGALTSRYVAAVEPQLVASVTSVGGPHKGSKVADLVLAFADSGPVADALAVGSFKALATVIGHLSGKKGLPEVPRATAVSLSTEGAADFNARFPQGLPDGCGHGPDQVQGVRYFSWAGTANLTFMLDPTDPMLTLLGPLHGQPNDGLVGICNARLGRHLGDYAHNHMDQVNQVLGMRGMFTVSPVMLYRQHANRLKQQGL